MKPDLNFPFFFLQKLNVSNLNTFCYGVLSDRLGLVGRGFMLCSFLYNVSVFHLNPVVLQIQALLLN